MTGGRGKRGMDGWLGPRVGHRWWRTCCAFADLTVDDSVSEDVLLFVGLDGFSFSFFSAKGFFFLRILQRA